jgi:adenosine deaminase CECR1
MPKGGMLHVHFDSLVDLRWLIENATYHPNCYLHRCSSTGRITFQILDFDPNLHALSGIHQQEKWLSVTSLRENFAGGAAAFDDYLFDKFTVTSLMREGVENVSDEVVWSKFVETFLSASGLIFCESIFRPYVRKMLEMIEGDGISYFETRLVGLSGHLYDMNGKQYPLEYTYQAFLEVMEEYLRSRQPGSANNPPQNVKLFGAKIIHSGVRLETKETIRSDLLCALELKEKFPKLMAGSITSILGNVVREFVLI